MKSTGITIKAGKEVRDEAMRKLEEGTKAIEGTDGETEGYSIDCG